MRSCRQELVAASAADAHARAQRPAALARSASHRAAAPGLVAGLTSYCGELERAHGWRWRARAEGDFASITPDAALCLYRIAQEALRNVIAHAGARRADVRLLQTGDQAEITIADDGRGFEVASRVERDNGLGLVSITERARIVGGTVSIVSGLNQGTRVRATIPMRARVTLEVGPGIGRTGRMTRRHTVLLADDHAIVTDGLSRILQEGGFEVVGAVSDGQALIDAATRLRPDVIITDLTMPGLTGLDVLARLKTERLDSKVIVLTMHNDADLATDAIRGGACGYLLKESAGEELLVAIRHALDREGLHHAHHHEGGHGAHGRRCQGEGAAADATTTRHPAADREGPAHEGDRVESGPVDRTVEGHKYKMMETLGVTSTAELVRYALDRRLNVD